MISCMSKWEAWLLNPWEWHPSRGGLGCNKEFDGTEIEARSSEHWIAMGLVVRRGH